MIFDHIELAYKSNNLDRYKYLDRTCMIEDTFMSSLTRRLSRLEQLGDFHIAQCRNSIRRSIDERCTYKYIVSNIGSFIYK